MVAYKNHISLMLEILEKNNNHLSALNIEMSFVPLKLAAIVNIYYENGIMKLEHGGNGLSSLHLFVSFVSFNCVVGWLVVSVANRWSGKSYEICFLRRNSNTNT